MLSMHDNEQYFFEALKAGASGYVLKSAANRDLIEACRATMRGEPFLYPAAVTALVRDYLDRARRGEDDARGPADPRELEVVKLIAEGHTSEEIAEIAGDQQEDGRPPPREHAREARDAQPGRADPLRDPAGPGRAVGRRDGARAAIESETGAARPFKHFARWGLAAVVQRSAAARRAESPREGATSAPY